MPELHKIVIQDFRNIPLQELSFSPNVNCISGGNGQGKTNLLDAIWYLSMTKSAFSNNERYNYRYGTNSFSLLGHYSMSDGQNSKFSIQVKGEGDKIIKRDDKTYTRISEHIGVLPIVMVSPSDISMISESGDERRKFINAVLSQMDKSYLHNIQQYNRILSQRNHLLKAGIMDEDLLQTFDERMDAVSRPIFQKRQELCSSLEPIVKRYYSEISSRSEEVGIDYRSDLLDSELKTLLKDRREKDRLLRYTSAGIQRDDFVFTMDSHPIRRCGSQGQQKSFLVAIKFAQHEVMKQAYGFPPIMLLDDLFDKLDPSRIDNLLSLVADKSFGQIFLSDPDPMRSKSVIDAITDDRSHFLAKGGAFSQVNE